jgi:hypothetical protein
VELQNYRGGGLVLRESATGKILSFGFIVNTGSFSMGMQIGRYTNSTTFASTPYSFAWFNALQVVWFRVSITGGTTLNLFISSDGVNFVKIYSELKTASFTTAPDQWGYGIDPELSTAGQSSDLYNTLLSFKTT